MNRLLKKIAKRYANRLFKYFKSLEDSRKKQLKVDLINRISSVGYNVKLNGDSHIISKPSKVIIGNNVHIGNNLFAKTEGGLIIGDNTHISRNVTIYTENHNYLGKALPYDNTTNYKPVTIKENVWIGMNVSIIPGVVIGEGAIIGIGSVVNRTIEPYEIVGSPTIQKLKLRDTEHYKTLNSNKNFGGVNGEVLRKTELQGFLDSYETNKHKNILFILGTGRSGTVSITDLFNQHPNCKAFHEDVLQLIRISTEIAHNIDVKKSYSELNEIFKTKIWNASENQLIVHSDQRLWNLIPFLSDYFPNSKFIHLEREPIGCIKSMVVRNWYAENEYPDLFYHDWAKYRIQGDVLGDVSHTEWKKMTHLQKCTWYFYHVNNTIAAELSKLSSERTLKVELENIPEKLTTILKFSGLNEVGLSFNKKNSRRQEDYTKIESNNKAAIEEQISEEIKKYT
ncbi:acyltransferase [Psychroserpens sp.]|uniref:acyltransferase n=1 Tax=Psychroserpens sp. TaxID=2020870 RepID=UPI002B276889|nr:acyltransferase [Psychroserpens sp.]